MVLSRKFIDKRYFKEANGLARSAAWLHVNAKRHDAKPMMLASS